jgi:cell division transport system permease protein
VQLVSKNLMAAQFFNAEQVMLGIAAGGLLGLAGSWVSVGRHLRRVWRDA